MVAVPTSEEYNHPNSIIYYRVNDIYVAHEVLQARSVEFSENPHSVGQNETHDIWMAFLADPDGNVIGLVQDILHEK